MIIGLGALQCRRETMLWPSHPATGNLLRSVKTETSSPPLMARIGFPAKSEQLLILMALPTAMACLLRSDWMSLIHTFTEQFIFPQMPLTGHRSLILIRFGGFEGSLTRASELGLRFKTADCHRGGCLTPPIPAVSIPLHCRAASEPLRWLALSLRCIPLWNQRRQAG